MEDLAGFVVIGGFLAIAFGSIAACGAVGAAVLGLVPWVRRAPQSRRWWIAIGAMAGYGAGIATVLAILLLRPQFPALADDGQLPLFCWGVALVGGGCSRLVGSWQTRP